MSYFLFLLVTATMFVRPGEIIAAVQGWPIYNYLIILCMIGLFSQLWAQLSARSLTENPVTACIVGVWAAVVCSHLRYMRFWEARHEGFEFFKIVAFYLLMVAAINSPQRLKNYLGWLFVFIAALALIAVLAAYGVIELPGIQFFDQNEYNAVTGELISIPRLQSTGIFQDPNDLAMILVAGVVIALSFLGDPAAGVLRMTAIPALCLFGFCIYRTQSRGGLIALMAALGMLSLMRYGWRRTTIAAMVAVPLLLVAAQGRMTQIDDAMDEGSGHSRVELWSAGLQLFKQSPVFGIGQGRYADEAGQVAHNSFVHAFAELGFFGGAAFLGAFVAAGAVLYRLWNDQTFAENSELHRLLPYLAALVAGFAVSMLSLSRNYVATPYLALGIVTAYATIAQSYAAAESFSLSTQFVKRLAVGSVGFLAAIYTFILVTARL